MGILSKEPRTIHGFAGMKQAPNPWNGLTNLSIYIYILSIQINNMYKNDNIILCYVT